MVFTWGYFRSLWCKELKSIYLKIIKMKKLLFIIPLGLSLTAMSCSNNDEKTILEETVVETTIQQAKTINEDVDVNKFAELVAKEDGQILDVRTPEEWETGVIKGAIKINFFDETFKRQLGKVDKTKPVYVYCKAGGRSTKAAKQMEKMGFTTVYNLLGGMGAWTTAGKETVK
jgi:rhodanese-related sulfurtransferase